MSKVTLNNLTTLDNPTSAINIINNNNDAIETWSNDTVSRSGVTPNVMNSQFDMNSNHIINLPAPVVDTEPVRLQDINTIIAPSSGNVISIATPVGGALAVYSGTTGKLITDYEGNGLIKSTAGVPATATAGTDFYGPGQSVDIPITEGGTGASTAAAAFTNLKQQGTTSTTGVLQLATSAEAITGTDPNKALTPATFSSAYNAAIPNSLAPYSLIERIRGNNGGVISANYTLVATDPGRLFYSTSATAVTITIPNTSSVTFPGDSQFDFIQFANGKVTFVGAAGVTLLSSNNLFSMGGLYTACTLVYVGSNSWVLFGNLTT